MKKIILISLILVSCLSLTKKEDYIGEDSIRFRVIANSNSTEDQIIKEKVVEELSKDLFIKRSVDDTKKNIIENMSTIENKINKVFNDNNYPKTYNITYGYNEFPEKTYKGKIYKKGMYESLVIEIGEAKGNNYWCFLYPSLCMEDYQNKKNTDENNDKYKFYFIEKIKNIF